MKTKYVKYFLVAVLSFVMICFSGCSSSKNTGRPHQMKTYKDKPAVSMQKKANPPKKDYKVKGYKHNTKPVGARTPENTKGKKVKGKR
ncbi:MAG: hypothetical protein LBP67_07910 [Bacteroidales bacterium]|jgi:hypothetical protein|nr:hypothetical protein [Bacteroidales bacterium]